MRRLPVVIAALALGVAVHAAPAAADAYPCGKPFSVGLTQVQYCPDWSPNNWIPVYANHYINSGVVGQIYAPGGDWYACQRRVNGSNYPLGAYQNNVWALTMADNNRWGWVSEVYFRGGGNYEADATLRWCP